MSRELYGGAIHARVGDWGILGIELGRSNRTCPKKQQILALVFDAAIFLLLLRIIGTESARSSRSGKNLITFTIDAAIEQSDL